MPQEALKPQEFDVHLKNGTLRLAFIGMSNAGKSYRSRVLNKEADFLWHHVDGEIQKALGFADIGEVSRWLGYPTSAGYAEREKKYLALENRFTKDSAMRTGGKNLVFDTTGSVVHLEKETLRALHENCLIVHLDVGEDSLERMVEKFFKEPKPVAWAGNLVLQEGESEEGAVRRSYPALLSARLVQYRELAHINVPAEEVRDTSAHKTLAVIRSHLA